MPPVEERKSGSSGYEDCGGLKNKSGTLPCFHLKMLLSWPWRQQVQCQCGTVALSVQCLSNAWIIEHCIDFEVPYLSIPITNCKGEIGHQVWWWRGRELVTPLWWLDVTSSRLSNRPWGPKASPRLPGSITVSWFQPFCLILRAYNALHPPNCSFLGSQTQGVA